VAAFTSQVESPIISVGPSDPYFWSATRTSLGSDSVRSASSEVVTPRSFPHSGQVDIAVDLVLLARGGDDDGRRRRAPRRSDLCVLADQLARALDRLDFTDQIRVGQGVGVAELVAIGVLGHLAEQGADEFAPPMPTWRWISQIDAR
jgi:hypothetical protein